MVYRRVLSMFLLLAGAAIIAVPGGTPSQSLAAADDATQPLTLRHDATIHSIGIEWDVAGDANHNAACTVKYRKQGAAQWSQALPLFRVDYAWYYGKAKAAKPANMLAGSILFLSPATTYDVQLSLADPDGGGETKTLVATTRPIPEMPKGGRTLHVVPGEGGGTGSQQDPFKGLAAADTAVKPGDIVRLRAGSYGDVQLDKGGAERGQYIVWTAAGDGEAVLTSIKLNASHIWLDGLTLKRAGRRNGITTAGQPVVDAVITRNRITGYHYCILMNRQCRDWHIADNVLVGSKTWPFVKNPKLDPKDDENQALSGEGVEMAESVGGHVLCYNTISHVADGVSYPGHDCDVYGNDIFQVTDDAVETDRGWANVRVWGNRIADFGFAALSFQPMNCGPWYFVRNQIVGTMRQDTELRAPHIFKFRVQDRFALVNNTIVFGKNLDVYCDSLFTSFCRNNLFISSTGSKPIWVAMRYKNRDGTPAAPTYVLPMQKPGWMTDVDYNGYDWGADAKNWRTPVFRGDWTPDVHKNYFVDLKGFAEVVGVEKHGLRVRKEEVFEQWTVPAGVGDVGPTILQLKKGGPAIDAASELPNVIGPFTGKAPDLGCQELGVPLPHYGVRDEKAMKDHARYWAFY